MMQTRRATPVDTIAETYLDEWAALDPSVATYLGIPGHDDRLPALTPDWFASRAALRARTSAALASATPTDANDRITVAALGQELELAAELRAAGEDESDLRNIASPLQNVRDTFDLTPVATVDDWAAVSTRLGAVSSSIDGYIESLRFAADSGHVRPRRQVRAGIEQCADNVGPDGFFRTFAAHAQPESGDPLPASLKADLARAGERASDAYARLSAYLSDELLPLAPDHDPVGRELYSLHSRSFLGARVDLEETYEWGQQELARISALMAETAARIKPGATVREAMAHLNGDPARTLHGTAELQAWMQSKSDAAVIALADTHFDIPVEIRRLECLIAPTQIGGIYYTGPSEDLVTRPGRMWWSVPKGETEFATWSEISTVYHEGVPGHHLQIAQTVYRSNLLNRWRRLASWVSGHGEGWALYAERLMDDLGYLDDPGDLMGMLDSQSFRAARVVLDIGIHCDLPAPTEVGGGAWDYDKAWRFLAAHVSSSEGTRRFELDRYLGWPGQAPSYKVGERMWLQLREDARAKAARDGVEFDLKAFHRSALDIGSVGLDVLRSAVLGEFD
ncbi:MAG: DUF885 domain-containing protein [Actinomycetota bacterium]|nr:DUF885 domain-containing protein [Actinomycetota bacterium]